MQVIPIAPIAPRFFDTCPICGSVATDDEHVPPAAGGGAVMTRTCGQCNNGLGSRVEADLVDWHDDALTLPAFSADVLPGRRRGSRILCRRTSDGRFILIPDGKTDPAVRQMLASGQIDLSGFLPNTNRVRLVLLKHSFLAACLRFGVLEGLTADAVRADLVAARDAPNRDAVPTSAIALGLTVLRSAVPLLDSPLVHAVAMLPDRRCDGVVMAGTTFVSWSSDRDVASHDDSPFAFSLSVGKSVEGLIVR